MPDVARKQARSATHKSNSGVPLPRLEPLIEAHGGVRAVSKVTGIPKKTLYNYLGDDPSDPPASTIALLCRKLKVDANELLEVEGPYVAVPLLEVKVDDRGKAQLVETENGTKEIHFRADWLFKRNGRKTDREDIFAFQTEHATMRPVKEGDVILVDRKNTREQKGALFLVLIAGSATIVTLEPLLNSKIRMKNDDGETEDIPRSDIGARLKNCGRVFWRGGKV